MDVVYDSSAAISYEALKDVPAGTPLSNQEYWMKLIDNNVIVSDLNARLTVLENYDLDTRVKIIEAIVNDIGNPNGLAQLGSDGKLLASQMPDVSKEDVGLGNVENVSVNNMAPTFDVAQTLSGITSGDTLSELFSQIAKCINDVIAHNSDNTRHLTSEEREHWDHAYEYVTDGSIEELVSSMIDIDVEIIQDDVEQPEENSEPNPEEIEESLDDDQEIDIVDPDEGGE